MCSCEVSKAEFDDLKATVDELRASIGRTEADNNDVMSSMEEMATCMAGIVDRYSTDEPETTLEMKVPSMQPTERRVTMEPTERRVTLEPTERRVTMEPTERRVTMEPTERRVTMEPTERRVTMEPTERRVTVEPTERRVTVEPTERRVTMEPTERRETTGESPVTASPTEPWEMYGELYLGDFNKCGGGADRAFRETYKNLETCLRLCSEDPECNYASTDESTYCVGCKILDRTGSAWTAYEIRRDRRQLSELDMLRAENAALRAELAKMRRN